VNILAQVIVEIFPIGELQAALLKLSVDRPSGAATSMWENI